LAKAAKQQARTSISRTIGGEYNRKAEQLTQEANQFVEEMNKRAEEATRRTAADAKQFIKEANRRAEEAHRRAEEVIREAKESFIAELERRRLEEEKRVKEMAEQASKEISAAQARAQVAEQQTLEASKIAEEKIQIAAREASKLQEAFMEAMKQFNTNPIRKKVGQGKRQEEMDLVDSGSEDEVLHSLSQIRVPDDDELMSLATLPPDSLDSEEQLEEIKVRVGGAGDSNIRKMSQKRSLSKVRLFFELQF
jgi:hypothetical protein